jgi:hypothetical protein
MRLTLVKILPVAMTFCFLGSMAPAQQSAPDLVMSNGKIFTSNSSLPYVEALAIRGERIVAVGASKEIGTRGQGDQAHRFGRPQGDSGASTMPIIIWDSMLTLRTCRSTVRPQLAGDQGRSLVRCRQGSKRNVDYREFRVNDSRRSSSDQGGA